MLYFVDRNGSGTAVWASNTDRDGSGPYRLKLGLDNNLIAYDTEDTLIWSSGTNFGVSSNASLILKNTGNVELHDINGTLLWETATFHTDIPTFVPSEYPTVHHPSQTP